MNTLLANQSFVNSIIALIGTLCTIGGAIAAYIQLRGGQLKQAGQLQAVAQQAQHTQDTVAATPTAPAVVVAPIGTGGGARSLLELDPVRQGAGVTVSASAAPTGSVDCGLACVVSEIGNVKGTWSADELLRLRYFGVVDSRLTNASDIVGMLRANDIPAHSRNVDAATAQQEIMRNWQTGRSSIVLGDWISPGFGHWMRFIGADDGAEFMDPWPGTQRKLSWTQFAALYDGWYVHVDAAAPPPLCGAGAASEAAYRLNSD